MDPYPIGSLLGDLATVAGLIMLGSLFVAAEIALISLRESQIRQLSSRGKRGAKVAQLASNPNRFLAAAQVGVTVCGFLSAALGAETLGVYVIPQLVEFGLTKDVANVASLIGITLVIAYFSLVFGELVPKRLALFRTEEILPPSFFVQLFGCYLDRQILSYAHSELILKNNVAKCQKKSYLI
jgi:putative hemolysin